MSDLAAPYTTGSVTSSGTTIGYRQVGNGPGVVLLHGGLSAAQHYMGLATALADAFTVYVPDRRGRGLSGPLGNGYSMALECQDLDAILTQTGAHFVFGHSSGGLIALQAALTLPAVHKVALFEPPLSQHGSISTAWAARYERELVEGQLAAALITAVKGLNLSAQMALMPRWLLVWLMGSYLKKEDRTLKPGEVSLKALVPTFRFDLQLLKEMDSTLENFKALRAEVLLLGGQKSPAFLREILNALETTLPVVKRVEFKGVGHEAPSQSAPERVGQALRAFFSPTA